MQARTLTSRFDLGAHTAPRPFAVWAALAFVLFVATPVRAVTGSAEPVAEFAGVPAEVVVPIGTVDPVNASATRAEARSSRRAVRRARRGRRRLERLRAWASSGDDGVVGLTVAALVCGIVSLFVAGYLLGSLAILFGVIGMYKAKQSGRRGRGMGVAGIVLGILGFIGAALVAGGAFDE